MMRLSAMVDPTNPFRPAVITRYTDFVGQPRMLSRRIADAAGLLARGFNPDDVQRWCCLKDFELEAAVDCKRPTRGVLAPHELAERAEAVRATWSADERSYRTGGYVEFRSERRPC